MRGSAYWRLRRTVTVPSRAAPSSTDRVADSDSAFQGGALFHRQGGGSEIALQYGAGSQQHMAAGVDVAGDPAGALQMVGVNIAEDLGIFIQPDPFGSAQVACHRAGGQVDIDRLDIAFQLVAHGDAAF